jgi:hypothetical protein
VAKLKKQVKNPCRKTLMGAGAQCDCATCHKKVKSQARAAKHHTVKLTVIGGVADIYEVPKGITVEVRDYDCDAIDDAEDIKRDANGDRYLLKVWEGR